MSNPYQPPPGGMNYHPPASGEGDATGGVIPYKNPNALIAYYLSIASLLICPLGIVAVVLGILGLRARARNPVIKGSVHAWIGIILGTITTLGMILVAVVTILAVLAGGRR